MAIKLIVSKEEILKIDRIFWKSATQSLDESDFFYVNFSLYENLKNVEKVKVIYSKSSPIFFARFKKQDILKYAFGFYDSNLQLSLTNFVPLTPSFIFEFNLNSKPKHFESVFVSYESKIHLMLKIFGLGNKQVRYLRREGFSILKESKFDFYLLDFGSFKPFSKFLKNLNQSKNLKFGVYENKTTIVIDEKIKSKKSSKPIRNKKSMEINSKIPPKKENGQYSLYKGVSFSINQLKWISTIRINNKTKLIGYFNTEEEAYLAREEYIKQSQSSGDENSKSKLFKGNQGKSKKSISSKRQKKIPKKNLNGNFSEYDEISFDVNEMLWTAHFNNKFLGYFSSEEKAHTYRFNYIMSIPIPPLKNNGRYSLHKGVDFDKVYRLWYAKVGKKIIGKYNSENEAIEAINRHISANSMNKVDSKKDKFKSSNSSDKFDSNEAIHKKNLFLVDYDEKFIYISIKGLYLNYDASIFNFIDVTNLKDMIWDKKNNGIYDVIINLFFSREDYKNKLDFLLKFNFDNSGDFIQSLDILNSYVPEEKLTVENKKLLQFSSKKQKLILQRQEKLKEITIARLEKEKTEQLVAEQLMIKLDNFIGCPDFNEDFIELLDENNLTLKNGHNIKNQLEREILLKKITPEEFESRLNVLISDEISYQSKKDQEKIRRENRGLDLRNNFEMSNRRNKNLKSFYLKYGEEYLSEEFRYKLRYYGLSEDIGYAIKDELKNLILDDQLDISDLDSKFNELLNNEKYKSISRLLNYSYNFLGEDSISPEFANLLKKYNLPDNKGDMIKEELIYLIKLGKVSKDDFMYQLEILLKKEKENIESELYKSSVVDVNSDAAISEDDSSLISSEIKIEEVLDYSKNYFGNSILNDKFKNRLIELDIPFVRGYFIRKKMNERILKGEVSLNNFEFILEGLLEEEIKNNMKSENNEVHSDDSFSIPSDDESVKLILCPKCHNKLQGDENFCIHCGHSLKCYCPDCGYENDLKNNFCVNCGFKLL